MKFNNTKFVDYMQEANLMYFKVVVYDKNDLYINEFDNYDLKNYNLELVRKYANYMVEETQVAFHKNKGYSISTTIIHIKES